MRVLSIETSSGRAKVALLESGNLVLERASERPNESAETLLPLVVRALAEAGWSKTSLDRLGVATGPGSFTGLRIGIALSLGLSLGLSRPLVGVGSLAAMARAVPAGSGLRCALLDARRGEVFAAVYDPAGPGPATELLAPTALPVDNAASFIEAKFGSDVLWLGAGVTRIGRSAGHSSDEADSPSARCVGLLAMELDPDRNPPEPIYVRDAGATLPVLPTSALGR